MRSAALESLLVRIRTHLGSVDPAAGPAVLRQAVEDIFADPQADSGVPVDAGGVPAEWLPEAAAAGDRIVLYLHGGGYVLGSIDSHRHLIQRIALVAEGSALALDYRRAPEHPHPAAVEDAVAAYRWLLAEGHEPSRLIIAGDSSGGGLTVATLVALRDSGAPLPAAGVCISPWVDLECAGESMTARAADDWNSRELSLPLAQLYLDGLDPRTPLAAPLYANLSDLPPLFIQVGTAEVLYDDATRLAARARAAGVAATLDPCEDMFHDWHLFPDELPDAQEAIARLGKFARTLVS